jgi:phosphohistidine phosphatase SixA
MSLRNHVSVHVGQAIFVACLSLAIAQPTPALVTSLRQGGYLIVMRHASSPREAPDKKSANPDNVNAERQLDQEGRTTATALGQAWRALKIPIGEVLTSPTYRALETIRYAQLPNPAARPELGDNGQSMSGGTEAQAVWLRSRVLQFPKGTNTVLITHLPNLTRAFPQWANGMEDGEALILGPDGKGVVAMIARVKIGEWAALR